MIPGTVIEKPSSLISTSISDNFIEGIANMEERLVIILELDKLIDSGVAQVV